MPNDFYGLPLHPLIVHATVVIVPLAALVVALGVLSKRFRAWAGLLPMILGFTGLILVPMSTSTGETLEEHVKRSALLEEHAEMGEQLVPWMIALLVVSATIFFLDRAVARGRAIHRAVLPSVLVVAMVSAVGTTVQVGRIGHSGAKAAWNDTNMNPSSARP